MSGAPSSTYRVQVHGGFALHQAREVVGYLRDLGVGALYTSPILRSAEGSTHGYDVLAHDEIDAEAGGRAALDALSAALRDAGLGLVVDIVPNHVCVAPPADANAWFWDVLKHGRDSRYARAFDIDWSRHGGRVLLPVLGAPLPEVLRNGEIRHDGDVLRYHEHVFPVAPGTGEGDVAEVLVRQHYLPEFWRRGTTDLNYRRFFDVTTLAGLRVEDPEVFDESHALVVSLVRDGVVTGLRIDHPDGLADPEAYLDRLAEATGGVWTVVEKILEPGEALPDGWRCAGTTGYDALAEVTALFVDPASEAALTRLYEEFTGDAITYDDVVRYAKRLVLTDVLASEVEWLHRLLPHEPREAVVELLVAMPVYRTYVGAGGPSEHDREVMAEAVAAVPEQWRDAARRIADEVLSGGHPAFTTRFQQTSGPAMAKGVEDTAFYRYTRLVSLNEVGSSALFPRPGPQPQPPPRSGGPNPAAAVFPDRQGMTTLSTHDTKRSEDVRARISLLSEVPEEWGAAVRRWSAIARRHGEIERNLEYLLFQTFVGAYPLDADRAVAYALKAAREQKQRTSWLHQDEVYEAAIERWVRGTLSDHEFRRDLDAFMAPLVVHGWTASLAQKLVQLTMPGVPDVYQGCELWDYSLVDPDNRRPVDYAVRQRLLAEVDAGLDLDAVGERAAEGLPKLLVTSRALRLRRERPDVFAGPCERLDVTGGWADRVVAFVRGGAAVTVVPRRSVHVDDWKDTTVTLPAGRWRDVFTGDALDGGDTPVAEVLARFPVALLELVP